ncbi:MAG: hypothetical protein JSR84_02460 [Proteobacteria bacterium]|nr:hypothetical protein [Pseudomonadota bacterium]
MDTIECGTAECVIQMGNDGIATASHSGLLLPRIVPQAALCAMRAAAGRQAKGLLTRLDQAILCCDPAAAAAATYPCLTPAMRAMPQAFVVSPGQIELCNTAVRGAGPAGLLRGVFLREDEARQWLDRTTRALAANRDWWAGRR